MGVPRPSGFPFTLNNAVDELLKREFDSYRDAETAHPLMKEYGIDAVPFKHEKMEEWRDAMRRGVQFLHEPTNLIIRGGIDDVWVSKDGELFIVDYKATSKKSEVTLDAPWQRGYKRQMEVYQWLFRRNGFNVSDTGYFVYVNGNSNADAFDGNLEFDMKILPYTGSDKWIEKTIGDLHDCLEDESIPPVGSECAYCPYREATGKTLLALYKKKGPNKKTDVEKIPVTHGKKGEEGENTSPLF